jgi:5-methylcytosine-specific restriction enzyme A
MVPSRITVGNEVDHIISKAKSGTDAMENLQTACHACHLTKTATEQGAEPRQRQRIGVDGYPINEG